MTRETLEKYSLIGRLQKADRILQPNKTWTVETFFSIDKMYSFDISGLRGIVEIKEREMVSKLIGALPFKKEI